MKHCWIAAKKKDAKQSRRSTGCASTSLSGPTTLLRKVCLSGLSSMSKCRRVGWMARMQNRHIAATAQEAPRQPSSMTNSGTRAPASIPPRGTPVCLIEKTSEDSRAGVWRVRMWELAGVAGPSPMPSRNPASASTGHQAVVVSASAAIEIARPAWLMRIGPKRGTAPPLSSEAVIAPE